MSSQPVELKVGGQVYRVVSSADATELQKLARTVDSKLAEITGGKAADARGLLLAAMALAHDLEEQKHRADRLANRARSSMENLLVRVDHALDQSRQLASLAEHQVRSR